MLNYCFGIGFGYFRDMLKYSISTRRGRVCDFIYCRIFSGQHVALYNKINYCLNCLSSCSSGWLKVFLFAKDYFTHGESLKSVQKNEAKCESLIIALGDRPTSYSHTQHKNLSPKRRFWLTCASDTYYYQLCTTFNQLCCVYGWPKQQTAQKHKQQLKRIPFRAISGLYALFFF